MADDDHSNDRNVPINSDHVASISFRASICDKLSVPDTPFHCRYTNTSLREISASHIQDSGEDRIQVRER